MTHLTVVIPAKDEAATIERALDAIVHQELLPVGDVDAIVLANNCGDDTAERVRRFAERHPIVNVDVVEATFAAPDAHVGVARRTVMDLAAERFARRGVDGIIASTDADTVVDRRWVANTLAAMRQVDAVAGRIVILPEDWRAFPDALREAYARDGIYYRTIALVEATIDAVPWDPAPRHADHFGGSFAVRASAYRRVGGLPPVPCLEDVALYRALLRADVPLRHARDVRVATSGRRHARVTGGFATHLEELAGLGAWHVPHPQSTLATVGARAALRRVWQRGFGESDVRRVHELLALPMRELRSLVDFTRPFGESWERVEAAAAPRRTDYPDVPVESALARLRAAIASANAAVPTRSNAASGAG